MSEQQEDKIDPSTVKKLVGNVKYTILLTKLNEIRNVKH